MLLYDILDLGINNLENAWNFKAVFIMHYEMYS